MYKRGDIVRTPGETGSGPYNGVLAVVIDSDSRTSAVHTGKFEVAYENEQLTHVARIAVNKRRYSTPSGNRFNVCIVSYVDGRSEEIHVQTGKRGEGEETRAFEVRRLVLDKLVAKG